MKKNQRRKENVGKHETANIHVGRGFLDGAQRVTPHVRPVTLPFRHLKPCQTATTISSGDSRSGRFCRCCCCCCYVKCEERAKNPA
ncbi:hypothetical protein ElyMa_005577300 [Elysia marginata]|uniref:Uncharacterized protein n=1 Tax=Elysia marginata TaxID=1093978 RepID=A0AAV4F414_9GAST|nr:hypothetical protein ElyMa_005577300 [Elysia marginata]